MSEQYPQWQPPPVPQRSAGGPKKHTARNVLSVAGAIMVLIIAVIANASPKAKMPTANLGHTAKAVAKPRTAAQVVAAFKAAGLPVGSVIVYTAADDPNHLLGRPNGYTSKTAWTDTRVPSSQTNGEPAGSVDYGGSVEVYPTAAGATAREQYIQSAEKSMPIVGTEYDYVVGDALVRVSSILTPTEAQAYRTAATKAASS